MSDVLAAVQAHPRHVVLGAVVVGLLAAPRPVMLLVCVAVGVVVAGSRPLAVGVIAGALCGVVWADERLRALDRTRLGPVMGEAVELRVHLLEVPRRRRSGARVALVRIARGVGRGERIALRAGPRVRWSRAPVGAELAVRGRLARLRAGEGHLRRRNAHGIVLAGAITATGARRGGMAGALDRLRARAERGVTSGLDPPRAALARGMVLGQDEALSDADREDFRASGLAHLLAASGQNVMLLAALALPLFAALGLDLRGRLLGALALIALYVPLAGAGPSIQRAGVMGAAGLVAGLAGRPSQRWYSVLLAGAVTLAVNPRSAGDPGWQLSFAAVLGILALGPRLRAGLVARRVPRAVAEATAITAAATLATAPLLAVHFERVSLVSLPANVLAAPAVAPVMWLGMLAAAAGVAGGAALGAATALNALGQLGLAFVGWIAHVTAAAPGAQVTAGPGRTALLAALCAAAAIAVLVPRMRRAAGLAGVLAAVALLAATRPVAPPDPRALVVSFLDVGQGDATLLQRAGLALLFDTGPPGSPLLERLRAAGVRRLDVLVVTHGQADHEGGTLDVLRHLPVGLLVDGGDGTRTRAHAEIVAEAARRGVRRVVPAAGQSLQAGPLEVRVLWPTPAARSAPATDPNDIALVAHVRDGPFDLLLPADAESNVTAPLDLPAVEALKVAHHGSEDTGLPDLVARLRPRVAVIECGRGNPFGHPRRQALAALRPVPALFRTDRDGTVRLTVRAGRMTVAAGA